MGAWIVCSFASMGRASTIRVLVAVSLAACGPAEPQARVELPRAPALPAAASTAAASATAQPAEEPGSSAGRLSFARDYPGKDYANAYSVAVSESGRVVLGGIYRRTIDFGAGELPTFWEQEAAKYGVKDVRYSTPHGVFVAAFDGGKAVWSRGWGPVFDGTERARAVLLADGGVIVAGHFAGELDFAKPALRSSGGLDCFATKLDATGGVVWSRRLGGAGHQRCFAVATDSSGNVLLAGDHGAPIDFGGATLDGAHQAFVAVLDGQGRHVRSRNLGAGTAFGVAASNDGSVLIGGSFPGSSASLVKLDRTGAPVWTYALTSKPGPQWIYDVAPSGDGGAAIVGSYSGNVGVPGLPQSEDETAYVARIDGEGKLRWAHAVASTGQDRAEGVAIDRAGNVAWTGFCHGDTDIGGVSLRCSNAGMGNVFVSLIDPTGKPTWARAFGDSAPQMGADTAFTPKGDVIAVANGYGAFSADETTFANTRVLHPFVFGFSQAKRAKP